jgi:hypothetical protein
MHEYLISAPDSLDIFFNYQRALNSFINLCVLQGVNIDADTMHQLNEGKQFPIIAGNIVMNRKSFKS